MLYISPALINLPFNLRGIQTRRKLPSSIKMIFPVQYWQQHINSHFFPYLPPCPPHTHAHTHTPSQLGLVFGLIDTLPVAIISGSEGVRLHLGWGLGFILSFSL
jgi:hypothetical protein